ncbi:MAG: hypothetical protein WBW62_05200 [Solirubrobacterales bacterium]
MQKKFHIRKPSPALIVAILALVLGASGTAVAATQINGNNIKPGSIHGSKLKPFTGGLIKSQTIHGSKLKQFTGGLIKKETIGAGKIKLDSLGGDQIDESTLGPVPTADRLSGSYQAKVSFGQSVDLAEVGPFKLIGQCIQNGTTDDGTAGRDIARILISSTETGGVFTSDIDSKTGNAEDQFLGPNTPEVDRVISEIWTSTGESNYKTGGQFSALAESGSGLVSPAGSNTAAVNLFDTGCTFQGAAQATA